MKIFNDIDWELKGFYIIESTGKFTSFGLEKVQVIRLYEKCVEFEFLPISEKRRTILIKKSDFEFMGEWRLVEQF